MSESKQAIIAKAYEAAERALDMYVMDFDKAPYTPRMYVRAVAALAVYLALSEEPPVA